MQILENVYADDQSTRDLRVYYQISIKLICDSLQLIFSFNLGLEV